MTNILFICLGNICHSPMAEFVMRDLVEKAELSARFSIASAATSREELGNPGIACEGHAARQLTRADYEAYDLLIGMDRSNLHDIERICGGDLEEKVRLLMEYAGRPGGEVADPWYTGDFEATWRDVLAGCRGLLDELVQS